MAAWLVLVLVLVLSGCNSSATATAAGSSAADAAATRIASCDRGSMTGTCSEYAGAYLAQNEILLKSSCAKLGGTFVDSECPNTSVVGNCTLSTSEVRKFYGTGASAFDASRAQKECETTFRGVWTAR